MTAEAKALALIAAYLIVWGVSYGPFYYSDWCQSEAPCATLSAMVWPIASIQAISFSLARPS